MTAAEKGRCAVIAEALDRGDLAPWRRAEASLSPAEKGLIWDLRRHVQAQAARNQGSDTILKHPQNSAGVQRGKTLELRLDDLDFWAYENDDDGENDDDPPILPVSKPDPNEQQKTKSCPNCRGLGLTSDGVRCARCNGSGRIDRDDVDDGDEDDDWKEDDE